MARVERHPTGGRGRVANYSREGRDLVAPQSGRLATVRADARDLVLDCHGAPSAPRPSQSPIDRVLLWIAVALIAAGTFLGVSKHGQPLVPRARELFVPGGLILLVIAWRCRRGQPVASFWIVLVGLA